MTETTPNLGRLRTFITQMTHLVNRAEGDETLLLEAGHGYMQELVAQDDWLPELFTRPHPEYYQQYLLHCDPLERFSVVSFVWGPGQTTPIHDHTVWGLIGMLRGAEFEQQYAYQDQALVPGKGTQLNPGDVAAVSPRMGDIHKVSNVHDDRTSISVHVYGANIGKVKRHVMTPQTGAKKDFISGYANTLLPNLWGNAL